MTLRLYRLDGHLPVACSFGEWDEIISGNKRTVADDMVGKVRVSTVFLGIDHNFGTGEPILFETMVFNAEGRALCFNRYTSWDEAEKHHHEMVNRLKKDMK